MEKTAHVADYKKKIVQDIVKCVKEYPIIGVVNMENLPAPQLQSMRAKLRGKVQLFMTKKRLMKIALEQVKNDKKGVEELEKSFQGMPALLFTKDSPFKLSKTLQQSKSPAPAKAGQTAPKDLIIPQGPTSFAPGPIISELSSIGIKTGVEGGKVAVKEDSLVAKEGEKIKPKVAEVLTRMGIEPMEVGLDLVAAYEDGVIYSKDVLQIDEKEFMDKLNSACAGAFNLAMFIEYPTKDTINVLLGKAFNDAKAIGLSQNIIDEGIIEELLGKAERSMLSLKDAANIEVKEKPKEKEPAEEVKKEEPKKEVKAEEKPKVEEKKEEILEKEKEIIEEEKKVVEEAKEKEKGESEFEKEAEEAVKEEEEKKLEKERVEQEKKLEKLEEKEAVVKEEVKVEEKKPEVKEEPKVEEKKEEVPSAHELAKKKEEEPKKEAEPEIETKEPEKEEDIYEKESREELTAEGEISPAEEGFMEGYEEAGKTEEEKKEEKKPESGVDEKIKKMVEETKKFVAGEKGPSADDLIKGVEGEKKKDTKAEAEGSKVEEKEEKKAEEKKEEKEEVKVEEKAEEPKEEVPKKEEKEEVPSAHELAKKKKKDAQKEVEDLAKELVKKGTLRK